MTILHLAYSDTAGVPGRWAAAHREIGLKAELLIETPDEYAYGAPAWLRRWSNGNRSMAIKLRAIRPMIDWADVLMVYDHPLYLVAALRIGKPVLFRALGSHTRKNLDLVRSLIKSPLVMRATAGTGDLALALDIPLAGCGFPEIERCYSDRWGAGHSPSNRELKGTAEIIEMASACGWTPRIIEDSAHADVLEFKRGCSIVIDQFGRPPHPDGIGVSAIEAMAMGLPVVGRATPPVQELYTEVGCPALLVDSEDEFCGALDRLSNHRVRSELGSRGRQWVKTFHDGQARAREDLLALEALV